LTQILGQPCEFQVRGLHDRHDASWEAQFARLAAYKAEHGDCNVPPGWGEDPKLLETAGNRVDRWRMTRLGIYGWVVRQREVKRKLDRGEASDRKSASTRKVQFTGLTQNSQVDPAV
jgi:hypothetical protein